MAAECVIYSLLMSQSHILMSSGDECPPHCLPLSSLCYLRLLEAQYPAPESSSRALRGQHPARSHEHLNKFLEIDCITSGKWRNQIKGV